jgi:hypothetical protein
MCYVNRPFIFLLILNIFVVNVQLNEHGEFVNNDNELSEFLHENLIENFHDRVRRAIGGNSTVAYDGSGSITCKNY